MPVKHQGRFDEFIVYIDPLTSNPQTPPLPPVHKIYTLSVPISLLFPPQMTSAHNNTDQTALHLSRTLNNNLIIHRIQTKIIILPFNISFFFNEKWIIILF